jgi:hypothetical protein
MKLNYDMISLFLIFFIFYYLLFIISTKYVEGGDPVSGPTDPDPTDTDPIDPDPTFENETIQGTIIFNGNLMQSAGREDTAKRILFETNFKEDLLDILNNEGKINILREQISIKKIHPGSIIVEFKVEPHYLTGVSISKDYFSYLLSGKLYFPTIKLHTNGSVTDVSISSWYNVNHWPKWIWYIIISTITFLIISVILV